ncbi:hypothetical protein DPMN_182586, partial [Dreissena polymorpha]
GSPNNVRIEGNGGNLHIVKESAANMVIIAGFQVNNTNMVVSAVVKSAINGPHHG